MTTKSSKPVSNPPTNMVGMRDSGVKVTGVNGERGGLRMAFMSLKIGLSTIPGFLSNIF